jgi:hypothetical protein
MSALADLWRRLRSLGRRREIEDGLQDEIRFHVEQQIAKNRRAGMAPDEASRGGVVDEVGFNIHPVLIGSGVPALPPMARQVSLELVSCEPFKNGCVNVVYKVGAAR